jgi:hypothetical protein
MTAYIAAGTIQSTSDARDKVNIRDTILGLDFINKLRAVDYKWNYREDYKVYSTIEEDDNTNNIEENNIEENNDIDSNKREITKKRLIVTELENDGSKTRKRFHHGLIAQEVEQVIKDTGIDFGGFQYHKIGGGDDNYSIGYGELICPLIKAVQELTQQNKEIKEMIVQLKQMNNLI